MTTSIPFVLTTTSPCRSRDQQVEMRQNRQPVSAQQIAAESATGISTVKYGKNGNRCNHPHMRQKRQPAAHRSQPLNHPPPVTNPHMRQKRQRPTTACGFGVPPAGVIHSNPIQPHCFRNGLERCAGEHA